MAKVGVKAQGVDEMLQHLQQFKGVVGTMVVNKDGVPLKSSFPDEKRAIEISTELTPLCIKAKEMCSHMVSDELQFVQFQTKKHEIMVVADPNYFFIVIQNPSAA
eukprot:c9498_g1_i1.p1 GENE.c9498_g1_i1~~c9498_g1_i1.p1  ORF type:complete len:122 (+),score=34.66 c9498_g1_i1:54-368(+)